MADSPRIQRLRAIVAEQRAEQAEFEEDLPTQPGLPVPPPPTAPGVSPDTRATWSLVTILQTLPPAARLPGLLLLLAAALTAAYLWIHR